MYAARRIAASLGIGHIYTRPPTPGWPTRLKGPSPGIPRSTTQTPASEFEHVPLPHGRGSVRRMKGVIMRVLLQLILAAHFMAAYSNAIVYYVDAQGDDSNPGSTSAPFRTLMRGAGAAGPGDTVLVRDGIYGHENAITGGDDPNALQASPVVLKNSGTPDAWIIIRAEHKWGATLDCEMQCDSYVDLKNASYIQIQDFVITGGYKEGIHSNNA